ncbi:hypothetical protein V5O48_013215 [Marasmius crinis-equi]|uniref:Uncharacterized protein n=1 Tax=Marasmius crinis-equi TaxID=585013 RepID=A0ABR3F0P7_9AGAR
MSLRRSLRQVARQFGIQLFPDINGIITPNQELQQILSPYRGQFGIADIIAFRHTQQNWEFCNQDPLITDQLLEPAESSVKEGTSLEPAAANGKRKSSQSANKHPKKKAKPGLDDQELAAAPGTSDDTSRMLPMKKHDYEAVPLTLCQLVPDNSDIPKFYEPYPHDDSGMTNYQKYQRERRLNRKRKKQNRNISLHQSKEGFHDHFEDSRLCSTGWQGLNATNKERDMILEAIESGAKLPKPVVPIYYNTGENVAVTDEGGIMMFYRSAISLFTLQILAALSLEIESFISRCSVQNLKLNISRGIHWFCIAGVDRNCKQEPKYSPWHRANRAVIDEFFQRGRPFMELTIYGCNILRNVFPAIAMWYARCAQYMSDTHQLKPKFDLFWNFCLNGVGPATEVPRVQCKPHVDFKNIALGVCMIFIYGHFNHSETCWLVAWEAGVAFELPPGVFLLYPSSLFLHFNIDVANLDFVVTKDGKTPTRSESEPLCASCPNFDPEQHGDDWKKANGRGSMVWFNQATMFQTSELDEETGYTQVGRAEAAGAPSQCNTEYWKSMGIHPQYIPE